MKNIVILGSTGSIGVNALKIVESRPDCFRVVGLTARSNLKTLKTQIEKFGPKIVSVADAEKAKQLRAMINKRVKIVTGVEGAIEVAVTADADVVLSAMVGAVGLAPTLAAIKAGKMIALANKETMVTAGQLVSKEARAAKVKIIPVDSEHSAIFQALRGEKRISKTVSKLILTASGGPFRTMPISKMRHITVDEALCHPVWSMGPKISIDSATMMNKGLEVIEARWLFNLPPSKIEVLIHPQSIIHSMVEFHDTSVIAQMGLPDMRAPISFALNYPDRLKIDLPRLNLAKIKSLTFEPPDMKKFPSLKLAYDALSAGGSAPAVLNAANEVAVAAFLENKIAFTAISEVVEQALNAITPSPIKNLPEALTADKEARIKAREIIKKKKN
ncbi:1-deoxy-D-xylulose 5-phosphate reductoisomerase [hydrothermal vent metagenome]|uniref:1-deoxy-D-xylulose-5-phosphate reductoisomerase n=1 Tax=hydrothermal vent metagenome TaxID=652676 RepID=A0A3B1BYB7_9ZZZZ